jgi:hypothetical protein
MNRIDCVICGSNNLIKIYELPNYPICRHSILPQETDICADLIFSSCNQCGCVQLVTLQDPNILYKENNNQTFATKNWIEHHQQFADFILENLEESSELLEIGGTTGILAKKILEKRILPYKIVDLCSKDPNINGVEFINNNAEIMRYNGISNIVMSHVFEHLYNPSDYIKKLKHDNVKNIYISIPNMQSLLDKSVLLLINVEHTFYCDKDLCISLFESIGYLCKNIKLFNDHSLFFHFTLDTPKIIDWYKTKKVSEKIIEYFKTIHDKYNKINIEKPFYLAPAGYYGQMMYTLLKKYNTNIIGFLDNDPLKLGQRIYGTPLYIESPKSLINIDCPIIVISASLYLQEIKQGFLEWNKSIQFIYI